MAKFYGTIGFAVTEEVRPGVWEERMNTGTYSGDLMRSSRQLQPSDGRNDNVKLSNDISIIADPFAYKNFQSMRYVEYLGVKWKITNVEVQYPRLILTTGDIYHGD